MKKLGIMMLAAVGMAVAGWAGDRPQVYKIEVTAAGISTNVDYTEISDSSGWREIDRVVVPPTVATGTVTVALCELGTVGTNGVYAAYTETVAASGTLALGGTYANRPYLYRTGGDGTNTAYELYSGRLLKTTVTQNAGSDQTNTWTVLVYTK